MKTYTYYVYHIQGIKIGCTTELENRMNTQGFSSWEILWQAEGDWDFGWTAGDKELELQKQYGYKVDTTHYQQSREARREGGKISGKIGGKMTGAKNLTKEARREGGKIGGKIGGKKVQSIERICPHCSTPMKGSTYFRWHGDHCKQKTTQ
jgi:hypothetical protein